MQHSIRLSLSLVGGTAFGLANFSLTSLPASAEPQPASQEGSAADLGVMSISLKDAVQFNWGFQAQTQGAGTPNAIGIGAFIPLKVNENSVWFLDAKADVNLPDIGNSSSLINTEVEGTTISTSTRLGYRWLNGDRSWMFGVNAGYDSRPLATGQPDTGIRVSDSRTVFFQQVAAGLEAVSNHWNVNAYALIPVGTTEYRLNSGYLGGALDTYGLDVGYNITPDFRASVGYYYQDGDLNNADGSGVLGRLAYDISNGLTIGTNLSYDSAYETRFSADIKYRFGSNGYGAPSKKKAWEKPTIKALTETVKHRDVRVHDKNDPTCGGGVTTFGNCIPSKATGSCLTTPNYVRQKPNCTPE
ncbi:carbamoyl-phosphate synthase [Cyanobium sp. Morenito 9A2]|uniref:carbamoyl-phosphate synthase n=1 Tax=Cyanobium sp. Morenito 9A2 TaxID=2823718 RepID=UPI0020CBBD22|nr:carbamoyl-phosphate synthase [Cyanobium sp. Morenito 9A2]